jgi:hypothetical protein
MIGWAAHRQLNSERGGDFDFHVFQMGYRCHVQTSWFRLTETVVFAIRSDRSCRCPVWENGCPSSDDLSGKVAGVSADLPDLACRTAS